MAATGAAPDVGVKPGWYAMLVADTGTGMDASLRERAFELFTTKGQVEGIVTTGLLHQPCCARFVTFSTAG